ncbi:MAG: helix-turn-helix domain-containing protein [Hymenobacter sp.]|nr:helix-turn-helix domain-containing protein [Hymenobacter sp.]
MRKSVEEPHLLAEFIQEQPSYSPDFKALVLRLLDEQRDLTRVSALTLVPERTLYTWLEEWNRTKKKPSSTTPATTPDGQPA